MPDKRTHRGPHPSDTKLFAEAVIADLRSAIADFSLLLTKDYADKSALKLVGDRFSLTERQRTAIMRSACSDQQLMSRRQREVKVAELGGKPIAIDGYNVLITIEAAMSGACVFKGRDGCLRDLASIHGTYRKVAETIPAVIKREVPAATDQLPSRTLSQQGGGEIAIDPRDMLGVKAFQKIFLFDIELPEHVGLFNVGGRVYVRFDHGWEPLVWRWYRTIRQLFLRRFNV